MFRPRATITSFPFSSFILLPLSFVESWQFSPSRSVPTHACCLVPHAYLRCLKPRVYSMHDHGPSPTHGQRPRSRTRLFFDHEPRSRLCPDTSHVSSPPRSRLFPTPRITITVFPTSTAPSPTPQPRRCSDHEHDYGTSHAHGFYPDTITLVSPDDHEPHSCFEIALPETRRIQ